MAVTKSVNATWVSTSVAAAGSFLSTTYDASANYATYITYQIVLSGTLTNGLTLNLLGQSTGATFTVPVIVASAGSGLAIGTYSDVLQVPPAINQIQLSAFGTAGGGATFYAQAWGITGI